MFSFYAIAQKKVVEQKNPYSEVDKVIDQKNDSLLTLLSISEFVTKKFSKEEERVRAIFYWISKNILYSPELMFTYKTNSNRALIAKDAFENKTGVCIGYAIIFDTLCKLSNIESYIIEGSTKQSFLPSIIGHAWNGVKMNGEWKLIDATWGSGYLQGSKYVKKLNNYYFLPSAEQLISSHIPIDPIWQMLRRPITLYQFYSNKSSTITSDWAWTDSITNYLKSDYISKISSTVRRLNQFGTTNEVSSNFYQYLKSLEVNYYVAKLNLSTKLLNEAVFKFNEYISFKNKQFTPNKSDEEISKIMPEISEFIIKSKNELISIPEESLQANNDFVKNNNKITTDLEEKINNESLFIKKYLSTKKNKRKELFYTKTYSVYGIPVK
ncbi:MAG: transglutaminase domain-containing protein [Bacteroidota bacterium]|nr:transglutaminase domain-containing protein [Bacteroidota bacterium]